MSEEVRDAALLREGVSLIAWPISRSFLSVGVFGVLARGPDARKSGPRRTAALLHADPVGDKPLVHYYYYCRVMAKRKRSSGVMRWS